MVIPSGVNIPMPRPYGGNPPVITRSPKGEGEEGENIIVQLVGEIGPTTQYLELYDVLDAATEKDDVEIRIDTPGGDVYTATAIVERMENSKANVITTASGLVASAGTFIWFYGKERRVNRWARFLFHCSSHGDMGRSLSILETSEKLVKYMKELGLEMLGAGLITRAEYVAAFENKADVELSASTIRARLGIGVRAEADPNAAPAEPGAAPAEPAVPAEPGAAPAAPAEPAAAPAEPAAAPAEGGEGELDINAILADAGVEVPAEPAPAAPAEPAAPAAPAEPAAAPAAAPTEPVARCGGAKKRRAEAGGGVEPVAPAAPAAPAEPVNPAAPAEPAAAPAEPAPAAEPGAEETPVLDIAAIMADAGVEVPAEEPAAAPAEPAEVPAEPAAAPAEPAAAPAEPAPAVAPTARRRW